MVQDLQCKYAYVYTYQYIIYKYISICVKTVRYVKKLYIYNDILICTLKEINFYDINVIINYVCPAGLKDPVLSLLLYRLV